MHDITNRYQVFPWIKQSGCGVIAHPHLALRMSSSCTSTCLLCLHRNVMVVPYLFMTVWGIYIFTAVWYQIHCRSACTACDEWLLDCVWHVMAHAQKPDFVFRRNGWVHWNRRGRQFSRPLAAEVCASAVVMLDTPFSEAVWRVLATHSIRQFLLHFPSHASPCAITFQLESNTNLV